MENNVRTRTRVKMEQKLGEEFKVELEIEDGVNNQHQYTLKKEYENGEEVTKMQYNVNGEEGEVFIHKTVDEVTDEERIQYTIRQNGSTQETVVEKEVKNQHGQPQDE